VAISSQSCVPLCIAVNSGRSFEGVQDTVGIALIESIIEFVFLRVKIAAFHKIHSMLQSLSGVKSFGCGVEPRLISTEVADAFIASQIELEVQLGFVVALNVFIEETCRVTSIFKVDHRWHVSRMA